MTQRFIPPHASLLVTITRLCPALLPQIHQPIAAESESPDAQSAEPRARGPSLEQTQHPCVCSSLTAVVVREGCDSGGRPEKQLLRIREPGSLRGAFFFFCGGGTPAGDCERLCDGTKGRARPRTLSHSSASLPWHRSCTDTETQRPSCSDGSSDVNATQLRFSPDEKK